MPTAEYHVEAARRQLERVLDSPGFSRNERLSRFLRFIVDRHLEGKQAELKESVIAVEVFGRKTDHDPKQDSIVRTEAARLRARLAEYYVGTGGSDAVIIELPKGGYVPLFRQRPADPVPPAVSPAHRSPTRLWLSITLAVGALCVASLALWRFQLQAGPIPIAVLPLTNLSQDPANDYFADGLTDEIIRNLSIIDGLAVRSQTSSFALKGLPRNIREAGKQLSADYILEGSVVRAGQQLRINAQLVRARDDVPVWSGRYDRELADALAIQDEISLGIVNSLRLKLGRGRRRYEVGAGVYDAYLHARALSVERGMKGVNEGIGALEDVIVKDPSFAPAYADLAAAYAARSGEFQFNMSDEMSKMRAAAEKAIQLDPLLAQAHYAKGIIYARDAQWELAEKSFRRAIEIDPSRSELHNDFSLFLLLPLGRIPEALQQARAAANADPLSPWIRYSLAYVLIAAGRYDEAARNCAMLPADNPPGNDCLGRARFAQGRTGEAIRLLETTLNRGVAPGAQVRGELGYAYARAGRREDAQKLAAATPTINPFNQALIAAGLNDKDQAFEALNLAAAAGPFRIGRILTFPEFALLRADPRLKLLRRKVGLPE